MSGTKNIKISFILPVYNVINYLEECMESILSQVDEFVEIILIDDGSIDGSNDLCDNYMALYSFIKVIHKKNEGPAIARNIGIKLAKGKYIAFVDSDDRIKQNSIKNILKWIENTNADICFMQAEKFYPNGVKIDLGDCIERKELLNKSKAEIINYLSSRPKYSGSACTKLFRTEFLKNEKIFFPEKVSYAEDLYFVRDCILKAKRYEALDFGYYEYRQNRINSRTSSNAVSLFYGIEKFLINSINLLMNNKVLDNKVSKDVMAWLAYEYSIMLLHFAEMEAKDKKKLYVRLKKYKWLLKYAKTKKIKVIHIMSGVLGLRTTSFILGTYVHLRKET